MKPVWIPPSPPSSSSSRRSPPTSPKLEEPASMVVHPPQSTPSSVSQQQPQHLAVIQKIVDQIHLGREQVSIIELKALDEAIVAMDDPGVIPHVDRAFVRSCASDPKVLVRFVGMVQDMLDPEYYATRVRGVWTKYRDYYGSPDVCNENQHESVGLGLGVQQCFNNVCDEEDEMVLGNKDWCLEERQPLVLVPIPNSTSILREYMGGTVGVNGSGVVGSDRGNGNESKNGDHDQDISRGAKKRTCEELQSDARTCDSLEKQEEKDSCHSRKCKQKEEAWSEDDQENKNVLASSKTKANNDCDWWPRGCLNSDDAQCPVLAKMYYSSFQQQQSRDDPTAADDADVAMTQSRRLQLNDIVQVYGILSLDPRGATFDASETFMSQQYGGELLDLSFGLDDMDSSVTMCIPPPSLLPRLHVLKYDILDLDVYMAQMEKMPLNQEQDMVKSSLSTSLMIEESPMNHSMQNDRQFTVHFFANQIFGGNQTAAEALLMVLMSMAERNQRLDNRTIRMPSGETLGCGSINYVLSNSESCAILHEKLNAVLGMVLPVVANITVSMSSLNCMEGDSVSMAQGVTAPTKSIANRLDPSILQLPRGSCVIVNQAYMSEGALNPSGQRTLTALAKMSSTHTIPYRFEGEMELEFEADVRAVVLSFNKNSSNATSGSKLMPCSLVMRLESQSTEMVDSVEAMISVHQESFTRIRRYIAKCRSNQCFSYNSIALDKSILERAQKDFIEARQKIKRLGGREVTEQDFHRWLLLTRLQARSQIGAGVRKSRGNSFEAEIEDWENALVLDDAMR